MKSKTELFDKKRLFVIVAVGLVLIGAASLYRMRRTILAANPWIKQVPVVEKYIPRLKTVDDVLAKYGESARGKLESAFQKAHVAYPPKKLVMLGLKTEGSLEIYAEGSDGKLTFVSSYPILGKCGTIGPKLKEGDCQIPEGSYRIQELEPNTPYHVAMRVNYPNDFDKQMGAADKRTDLGGDIMVHGCDVTIGCLAMGDPASEELFVLVHDVGLANTELVLCPYDFRSPPAGVEKPSTPEWIGTLYSELQSKISSLPLPNKKS